MSGEKTEKPTGKRISDARAKGQVAKSQDFNAALVMIAVTWIMGSMGPYTVNTVYAQMQYTFGKLLTSPAVLQPMSKNNFDAIFSSTLQSMIWLMLPFLLSVCVMAALSNLVQVRPLFTMQAISPKLDKLNPLNGFKRLFSMRSVIEVVKAIIKMTIIGTCGYSVISGHLQELMGLGAMDVPAAWGVIVGVAGEIAKQGCIAFLIIGIADWRYQTWELEKQLRMSKQDIKDERKNSDGDPMMKSRMRQMGMKMIRTRQLAAVPTADVVITNPTHYAIALKYDPDIAPAPVVVAMGKDLFAQKIKEVAKEAGVPMVENKPLARALYPVVEVEAMIPPDLFVAVAEVLAFVFAKHKGRRLAAQKRSKEAAAKEAAKQEAKRKLREEASE